MPKIKVKCEYCGADVYRYKSGIKEHVFCSRSCAKHYTSKRMSDMNKELNPTRMTDETKEKLRLAHFMLSKGSGKTYSKIHGRHIHRVMAEKKLGRKLLPGEIVHHKDGNKLNNSMDNLEILQSQSEHAKEHFKNGRFRKKVMANAI